MKLSSSVTKQEDTKGIKNAKNCSYLVGSYHRRKNPLPVHIGVFLSWIDFHHNINHHQCCGSHDFYHNHHQCCEVILSADIMSLFRRSLLWLLCRLQTLFLHSLLYWDTILTYFRQMKFTDWREAVDIR